MRGNKIYRYQENHCLCTFLSWMKNLGLLCQHIEWIKRYRTRFTSDCLARQLPGCFSFTSTVFYLTFLLPRLCFKASHIRVKQNQGFCQWTVQIKQGFWNSFVYKTQIGLLHRPLQDLNFKITLCIPIITFIKEWHPLIGNSQCEPKLSLSPPALSSLIVWERDLWNKGLINKAISKRRALGNIWMGHSHFNCEGIKTQWNCKAKEVFG